MKKTIVLIGMLFALSGCSIFGGVADKIADTVDKYCDNEPYSARQVYREQINSALAGEGHSVEVFCSGDPVSTGASMQTGNICKDASTKTQEDLPCQEHVTQLMPVSPLLLLQPLLQPPQVQLPLSPLLPPTWIHSALPPLRISQHSKPSLPHYGSNSASDADNNYNRNSPGLRNNIFS